MRSRSGAPAALGVLVVLAVTATPAYAFDVQNPQFGRPHKVTYDRYSLKIDGHRLVIWSGEFHLFRLPSPRLWMDVLQKLRAGGFNTVSLYFSWEYSSSTSGSYDLRGIRDINRLLAMTQRAGLYVIARPGPYINAEVDAGGFPGWLTRQLGAARTSAPDYTTAWKQWFSAVDPIIARHQITRGGNVIAYQIENELVRTPDKDPYMRAQVAKVKADGINVPTTANLIVGPTWQPIVDVDGPDIYPNGFDCTHPRAWSGGLSLQIDHIEQNARLDAPQTPEFLPEFQGGSFDPWGGKGYRSCYHLTNGAFQKIFNQTASAQGVTMRSLYMAYGGTSWGWQAVPTDYTSYDYGAPVDEARELTPKYYDLKRMGYAAQAVGPLTVTDRSGTPQGSNSDLLYALRVNPTTHTQFIFLRHSDPTSTAQARTTLSLSTPDGTYPRVPQKRGTAIRIHGRDMKTLVADYRLGAEHLVYSTSQLMTNARIGRRQVLVLYGSDGDPGETVLRYRARPTVRVLQGHVASTWTAGRHDLRLNYLHRGLTRLLVHSSRGDLLVVIDGEQDSGRLWLTQTSAGPVLSYGPYLVRAAVIGRGVLAMTGDTSASFPRGRELGGATGTSAWSGRLSRAAGPTTLGILAAPRRLRSVTWNGVRVRTRRSRDGTIQARLKGPPAISLPSLGHWRFHAEAPEARLHFPDSHWTKADHLTTNNVAWWTAAGSPTPVLFMDDYGFHYGNVWYRGHFTASGQESGVSLTCATGGGPSTCSAWINGHFLGTWASSSAQTFTFPAHALRPGKDNVISVLAENDGHQEDLASSVELQKQPRGLTNASLQGAGTTVSWRIQGDRGGEHPADRLHGPMNNGGLYGERNGWYEPGFHDSAWHSVKLPDRWSRRGVPPGVGWYRTHFRLNLPRGVDVPVGLRIRDRARYAYEALIFVNGWMMGRYANQTGPQHLFYLPDGVLREHGPNVIAIAVLSQGAGGSGGGLGRVRLQAYGRYRGLDLGAPRVRARR
ncbi:MAG: beta-galactosidase [Solirubrobacteraceae bacterium]